MLKFNLKNKRGITLIALVITIIVLLILAGVALSLVVGEDGITQRAVNAGKTQNIAGAKEKLELEVANLAAEFYQAKYMNGNVSESTIGEYVLANLPSSIDDYTLTKSGNSVTLTATTGSDRTTATATIDTNGKVTWEGTTTASAVSVAVTVDTEDSTKGTVATTVNGTYESGTKITLTATPASGYKLSGWYIGSTKQTLDVEGKYKVPTDGTTSVALVAKFEEYVDLSTITTDITYEPSGTYDWLGKYATSYPETTEGEGESAKTVIKDGSTYYTNIKLKTGDPTIPTEPAYDSIKDMSITKWKILKTDGDTVYLVPSLNASATPSLTLHGVQGYNNAVNLLDEACSSLYGNSAKGITAESIDMDLIEGLMQEVATADSSNTKWADAKSSYGYEVSMYNASSSYKTSGYSAGNSKYPLIYANEKLSVIGATDNGNTGLGMSDPWKVNNLKTMIERNTGTSKIGAVDGTDSTKLKPYQTYYYMSNSDFSSALGSYSSLLLPKGGSTNYWVASRCVNTNSSFCNFYVRFVYSGYLFAYSLFGSYGDEDPYSRPLFPVVSLSSELIKKNGSGNYYVDVQ